MSVSFNGRLMDLPSAFFFLVPSGSLKRDAERLKFFEQHLVHARVGFAPDVLDVAAELNQRCVWSSASISSGFGRHACDRVQWICFSFPAERGSVLRVAQQ